MVCETFGTSPRRRVRRAACPQWGPVFLAALALCSGTQAASGQAAEAADDTLVRHSLVVRLAPARHHLAVRDRLTVPAALVTPELRLLLNSDLKVTVRTPALTLVLLKRRVVAADVGMDRDAGDHDDPVRVNVYRIDGARTGAALTLELAYEGRIDNPIRDSDTQYARGFSQSPGLIEERGVYLAGSSYWVPDVGGTRALYRLEVLLPEGWKSVSEGLRSQAGGNPTAPGSARDVWTVETPTQELHLIAARFTEYERDARGVQTYAFLRTADAGLAARYLAATAQYLEMYQGMLGRYPYGKFSLVENFWETGYGMPSFTLLGEQIIRFPFIRVPRERRRRSGRRGDSGSHFWTFSAVIPLVCRLRIAILDICTDILDRPPSGFCACGSRISMGPGLPRWPWRSTRGESHKPSPASILDRSIPSLGIDLGLREFAAFSAEDMPPIEAERFYRDLEPKLARAQRARKTPRTRAIHAKIANRRKDSLHKLSTRLVKVHGAIFVGDVNASALAKTQQAKSVLDAGWSAFRTMLRYKCADAGVWFDEVDEAFSTQTCSRCKSRTGPKGRQGLGIRGWQCSSCGAIHDDVNAAQNILAAGHRRLAEGISVL